MNTTNEMVDAVLSALRGGVQSTHALRVLCAGGNLMRVLSILSDRGYRIACVRVRWEGEVESYRLLSEAE